MHIKDIDPSNALVNMVKSRTFQEKKNSKTVKRDKIHEKAGNQDVQWFTEGAKIWVAGLGRERVGKYQL